MGAPPIAQIGQMPDGPDYSRGKPPLPFLSFSFSHILLPHPNEYVLRRVAGRWNRSTPKTNSAPLIEDARSDAKGDKFRNLLELSIQRVDPLGE
jgi:hypothetical protein